MHLLFFHGKFLGLFRNPSPYHFWAHFTKYYHIHVFLYAIHSAESENHVKICLGPIFGPDSGQKVRFWTNFNFLEKKIRTYFNVFLMLNSNLSLVFLYIQEIIQKIAIFSQTDEDWTKRDIYDLNHNFIGKQMSDSNSALKNTSEFVLIVSFF